MSREIKFRAYFNNSGYIVGTDVGEIKFMDSVSEPHLIFNDYGSLIDNEFLIALVQFTGLLDKNGKEIYEGDLIKHSGYIYKIIFNNCGFTAINTDSKTAVPAECEFLNNIELEVIGNIFENSDLIKGGNK